MTTPLSGPIVPVPAEPLRSDEPRAAANISAVSTPEVRAFLAQFAARHTAAAVIEAISTLRPLRVLILGEAILDEYVYGDVIGKSAKEPILALRYLSDEVHAGGSVVIANHVAAFCDRVELITYLGKRNSREDFVRQSLLPNVAPAFVYKQDSPTIVKRRFVEKYLVTKLLEVYDMNDEPLTGADEDALCQELARRLPECDVVIAADYGHGLISPRIIDLLTRDARFLAVNTQINAANNGYHTLARYPRADYVCVHEGEIRLDQRSRSGELSDLMRVVAARMGSRMVMVTRGKQGTLLYEQRGGGVCHECPALAVRVVDRVGAGDSVLAITSLCAAQHLPPDLIGFIGNMVGAQAVSIVGNRASIDRAELCRGVEAVLSSD